MNPAKFALEKATFMLVMALVTAGLGIFGFNQLGRLENRPRGWEFLGSTSLEGLKILNSL